jgi:catechol 2,3-dioxygenase-like lactoylglutathione lyase family enzyme
MSGPSHQHLAAVAILVPEYDAAIGYYRDVLGFELVEDTDMGGGKRWVVVAPPGGGGCRLLLARAATPAQAARIGDQTGGRVFLFLHTTDFAGDFARYQARGVDFTEAPRHEAYGTVVVFRDAFGNLWDLVQPTAEADLPPVRDRSCAPDVPDTARPAP